MIVNLKKPQCKYTYICPAVFCFFFNLNSLLTILKLGRSSYKKKKRKEISPQLSKNIENNSRFSSSNLRGRDSTVCWCPVSQSPLSFLLLFFLSTSLGPRPAGTFFFFLIIFYYFWPHRVACRVYLSQPGVKLTLPEAEALSLDQWTAREVPLSLLNQALLEGNRRLTHSNMSRCGKVSFSVPMWECSDFISIFCLLSYLELQRLNLTVWKILTKMLNERLFQGLWFNVGLTQYPGCP